MSHIRKRVVSLEEGVQGVSYLSKALCPLHLAWAEGSIFRNSPLLDFWALSVQAIREEKETSFKVKPTERPILHQPNHLVQPNH